MSKIVCDVCGSTYSETEAQCPICGTAKSETAKPAVETAGEEQPTKGGKFSKTNTRKTGAGANTKKLGQEKNNNGEDGAPSNLAMIIIVTVLLLAIVAVCVFIAVRLFGSPDTPDNSTPGTSTSSTPLQIPCTGLELVGNTENVLAFTALTESAQLNVRPLPENTTEDVVCTYTSSDPSVVLVDQTGLVTPVASGTATITVAYGTHSITVNVTCDIPAPITELKLTKSEITLSPTNGFTAKLYNGELDPADITWTSSDETVAYVENGVVTAAGNGNATITATYGDLSATCKIVVSNMDNETVITFNTTWGIKTEATIDVGESVEIYLFNTETEEVIANLQWTTSRDFPECCTFVATEKGVMITGIKSTSEYSGNYVYIQTEYEGVAYKFIIRVR